jgi:oxygen-dependent protoporphyrinogen oxidase
LVVGAGISGLVCAYALRKAGLDALVIESTAAPGGVIRSENRDGYLLELGPQSFNATSMLLNLCRELGIHDQLIQATPTAPVTCSLKERCNLFR